MGAQGHEAETLAPTCPTGMIFVAGIAGRR